MKNMKKFLAALLALSMLLALCGTALAGGDFTQDQADEGLFVKFTGTLRGYNSPRSSAKSNIIVRKGSVGLLVGLKGSKWAKVVITDGTLNSQGKDKELWFDAEKLTAVKDQDNAYIRCIFSSGGKGLSVKNYNTTLEALKGKKITTTGKVNLHKNGSLQGKSLAVIQKGTKLTCTGKVASDSRMVVFFQVKYNGKKGYVSAEYIKNWEKVLIKALEEEIGI